MGKKGLGSKGRKPKSVKVAQTKEFRNRLSATQLAVAAAMLSEPDMSALLSEPQMSAHARHSARQLAVAAAMLSEPQPEEAANKEKLRETPPPAVNKEK